MKKTAIFIDGGYLRKIVERQLKIKASPDFIEDFTHGCLDSDEELYRAIYYDCKPYKGTKRRPISGTEVVWNGRSGWLKDLSHRPYFAVRFGEVQWRGWKLRKPPDGTTLLDRTQFSDDDFEADIIQKGVDMRIGLDIATLAHSSTLDRLLLVTGDQDFVPAMKYGRKLGLQIGLITLPGRQQRKELHGHADIIRKVEWPVDNTAHASDRIEASIDASLGDQLEGTIIKIENEKGNYGFIEVSNGNLSESFYFSLYDLQGGYDGTNWKVGDTVRCVVKRLKDGPKAGAVNNITKT